MGSCAVVLGVQLLFSARLSPADCNGDFLDDAEQIAGGTAPDCNGNGVPDECDLEPRRAFEEATAYAGNREGAEQVSGADLADDD